MARTLEIDAGTIDIRVAGVDDGYILDSCPWKPLKSDAYRAFCQKLQSAYGGHAVVAWHGDRAVAVLTFYPDGAVNPPEGMGYPRPCALHEPSIAGYDGALRLDVRSGILNMGCVGIFTGDSTYRRKKLASAMVEEALVWAEEHGYLTARALATPRTSDPEVWEKSADPGEAFWEKLGFEPTSRVVSGLLEMVRYTKHMPIGRNR
jgi:GNAT superfamily N-acetyltransferase